MRKILFLHGFYASGGCVPVVALGKALAGKAEVVAPDLPLRPSEVVECVRSLCDREKPNLIVGNSCGAFYAQMLAPVVGIPALLGNPHFGMAGFLRERIGIHQYKSPRRDGRQEFVIDARLVDEFAEVERRQFDYCSPYYRDKVWGLFGDADTLAHYEPTFLEHYNAAYHFPGGHTPTAEEVRTWYAPLVEKMLFTFSKSDGDRYFCHFKGGLYRLVHTAFDSESRERMVVYQAMYGERAYWVRPEKMFFERITRDGRTVNRFTEIDR